MKNIKRNEYFNSINSGIEIDGYKNFVFLNSRKNNVIIPRACLKFTLAGVEFLAEMRKICMML